MNRLLTKEEFLEKLKTDREFNSRYGRKHITEGKMVLPPCHYAFQFYTRELSLEERIEILRKKEDSIWLNTGLIQSMVEPMLEEHNIPTRAISILWQQRSVDVGLGWGFNVSSYSLLLMMVAKQVNMVPEEVICSLGDCHIYLNHEEGLREQLTRIPYDLPTVKISDRIVNDISEYTLEDFTLENYQSHPSIKLPLSN